MIFQTLYIDSPTNLKVARSPIPYSFSEVHPLEQVLIWHVRASLKQHQHGPLTITIFQEAPTVPRNPLPRKEMGLRNPRATQGLSHMAWHLPLAGDGRRCLRRGRVGLKRRRRCSQPPSLGFKVSNAFNQLSCGYSQCCLRCSSNDKGRN